MRQMISGLVAAVAVMTAGAAPADGLRLCRLRAPMSAVRHGLCRCGPSCGYAYGGCYGRLRLDH